MKKQLKQIASLRIDGMSVNATESEAIIGNEAMDLPKKAVDVCSWRMHALGDNEMESFSFPAFDALNETCSSLSLNSSSSTPKVIRPWFES